MKPQLMRAMAQFPRRNAHYLRMVRGKTFTIDIDFEVLTTVITDSIVKYLSVPRQHDHVGMLGCRYKYHLSDGRETLDPCNHSSPRIILWKVSFPEAENI